MPPDIAWDSEARFATLLQSTSEGIWGLDLEGRCVFANRACLELLGYARAEELLGRNMHDLAHHHRDDGTEYPESACRIYSAFRTGVGVEGEDEVFWRKDGSHFPARYRSSPVFEGSRVIGAVVFFEDISSRKQAELERRRAEEALRSSEARYRAVLAALVEGIVVRDPQERVQYANAAAEAILGLPLAQLQGRNIPDDELRAFWPDGSPCPSADFPPVRALRTGLAQRNVELVIHQPGGRQVQVSMNSQPFTDGEGATLGVVTSFFDISGRAAADDERRQLWERADSERRRLAAVVDAIPLAVGIAEAPEGNIVMSNAWVERILRHAAPPTGNIAAYTQWPCIHPDGRPLRAEEYPLARALRTGEVVQAEPIDYRFGDGTRGTIEVSAAPVRNSSGEIAAAVVVYGDITERRRLEADARRRAEFEKHLIGIVSHDLRNPLNAILMSAAALLQRDLDDRTVRGLERIRRSADRAARMVRDLLDFTQARLGGGLQIAPAPTDLGEVVQHIVEEVQLANPQREIRFHRQGDTHGVWDGDRILQALTNLLSNAVAYSPAASPIEVSADGAPQELVLAVRNGGPPIPEEVLPGLFEPMQRGRGAPDHAGKSIGLGLYIVLQIVRAHGGTISVRSSAEAGTRFEIRLPRRPAYLAAARATER